MTKAAAISAPGIDRDAVTKRSQSIRATFVRSAEPHLQVLADADRLADEIRKIVVETVPPPPIDPVTRVRHASKPPSKR